MVLLVMILVFSRLSSLESWNVIQNDEFDVLESWGISRPKRVDFKIKKKFPEVRPTTCKELHQTEEAPFTAIILFRTSGRLLCMGTIIDALHILTCKRCYEKIDVGDLRVLLGYAKAWWGRNSQIKPVKKIIRHEYEVALLRLKEEIKFTDYVQPVRLPSTSTKAATEIQTVFAPPYHVVGFFVDRYDVPGDFIDKDKIYNVKEDHFTDFGECKKNYTKLVLHPNKLFCTLGNATYCWGGWGAPVMKKVGEYYLQIGIVIADNCTSGETGPFLVARTDVFGDWIRGNSFQGHQPM